MKRRYPRSGPKYPRVATLGLDGDLVDLPHFLVALDLGKWKVGLAVFFVANGVARLAGAETVTLKATRTTRKDDAARAEALAAAVVEALGAVTTAPLPPVVVAEWPQKYETDRKAHRDLEALYATGRAIEAALGVRFAETYTPATWKGSVPKAAHRRRLQRELTAREVEALRNHVCEAGRDTEWLDGPDAHDTWDAIGVGLFATGRTRRGGTRP